MYKITFFFFVSILSFGQDNLLFPQKEVSNFEEVDGFTYHNNKLFTGERTQLKEDGLKLKSTYSDGLKNGVEILLNYNNDIKYSSNYVNGKLEDYLEVTMKWKYSNHYKF